MGQALKAGTSTTSGASSPREQFESLDADPNIVGVNGNGAAGPSSRSTPTTSRSRAAAPRPRPLRDPAFRAALDRAVDRSVLVDEVLNGYGLEGSTIVAPTIPTFRKDPANPRPFDLTAAAAALEAAGYVDSNGDGSREDKDGKEINLRIYFPDTDSAYPKSAQFIADWWGQIGIPVTIQSFDSDTLTSLLYTPEAGGTADYDIELWGWASASDPDFLLSIFTTSQIGVWSDSNYSIPGVRRAVRRAEARRRRRRA